MLVILYVRNDVGAAIKSINVLRILAKSEKTQFNLLVVDNNSTDGFYEWASNEDDFTYVYMDEGYTHFGKLINRVVKELEICEDFLLIDADSMLTIGAVDSMAKVLDDNKSVSVVTPKSNKAIGPGRDVSRPEYESFCAEYINKKDLIPHKIIAPSICCMLVRFTDYKETGFNEELENPLNIVTDFCLRQHLQKKDILLDNNSFVWKEIDNDYGKAAQERNLLEKLWGTHYFNVVGNNNIVQSVVSDKREELDILEIGCDLGATLLEIGNNKPNASLYGCDINEASIEIAKTYLNAKVGNIEKLDLSFNGKLFDYIIFGDVLEHLRNPEAVLDYSNKLLKKDGRIVTSIPNVMHISVMMKLINGRFTYGESGLLDKTHIHMFTYLEILNIFEKTGYEVEKVISISVPIDEDEKSMIDKLVSLGQKAEPFMYSTYQYLVTAKKKS